MQGYVYLFGGWTTYEAFHKIGLSVNPERRVKELNLPFEVSMMHKIKVNDMYWAERVIHIAYREYRYRNEWFQLYLEQVEEIMSIEEFNILYIDENKTEVKFKSKLLLDRSAGIIPVRFMNRIRSIL